VGVRPGRDADADLRGAAGLRQLAAGPVRAGPARPVGPAPRVPVRHAGGDGGAVPAGRPGLAYRRAPLPIDGKLMIDLTDVSKTFTIRRRAGRWRRERRTVPAVDGLTFHVEPGEIVGY